MKTKSSLQYITKRVTRLALLLFFCFAQNNAKAQDSSKTLLKELSAEVGKNLYTDTAAAKQALQKAKLLSEEINEYKTHAQLLAYYQLTMYSHFNDFEGQRSTLEEIDELIQQHQAVFDTLSGFNTIKTHAQLEKGNYFYKTGQFTKTQEEFETLISSPETDKTTIRRALAFLGSTNMNLGKLDVAEQYYQQHLQYAEAAERETAIFNAYRYLANVNARQKDYKKAIEYLEPSLQFYLSIKDQKEYRNNIINTYQTLAENYINVGDMQKALELLTQSQEYYTDNDLYKGKMHVLLGDAYTVESKWELAKAEYDKALKVYSTFYGEMNHPAVTEVYLKIGEMLSQKKELPEALANNTTALNNMLGTSKDNFLEFPDVENVAYERLTLTVLNQRLQLLAQSYDQTNEEDFLLKSQSVSNFAIALLNRLKPQFESKLDKLFLVNEAYPVFYASIDAVYELYKKDPNSNLVSKALLVSESSKATILLDALRSARAGVFSGVPQKLLDQQSQLNTKISSVEDKAFSTKNTQDQLALQDSLFRLRRQSDQLLKQIEKDYSKFYDLKYNSEVTSLSQTQQFLRKGEVVLNYFMTDKWLYLITISKDKASLKRVPVTNALLSNLIQYPAQVAETDIAEPNGFKTVAKKLYVSLFPEGLADNIHSILIIPDDLLYSIPFETLLASKDAPLLGTTVNIGYSPSCTFLTETNRKKKRRGKGFLGFAPIFSNTSQFAELANNDAEVSTIGKLFNVSQLFKGNEATVQNFRDNAAGYKLLHLATHAVIDNENPDYSYLAFSAVSDTIPGIIYVKDIYNTELTADLVTLSACETAKGRIERGEGVMSMARAFSYAGASSVVTSLWKVDDKSTATIMKSFYKHLKAGKNKSKALQLAKLDYLNSTDNEFLKHPSYWAGFVLYGNDAPTSTKFPTWILLLAALFGFILAAVWVSNVKRRAKKMNK